jgi:hypothetical protein
VSAGTPASYGGGPPLGNYALTAGSPANNFIPTSEDSNYPVTDFFGNLRPEPGESAITGSIDAGAVEFGSVAATFGANVTPTALAFGNVPATSTSTPQTLTLHNTGTVDLNNVVITVTAPFARTGGTCNVNLIANAAGTTTCTIIVVYNAPAAAGASTGTVTVTANAAGSPTTITGSPVPLTGTPIAAVRTATLTPAVQAFGTVARGNTTSTTHNFVLTNTGNVTMTGIADAVLAGTNANEFFIVNSTSTCGGAVAGKPVNITNLAPNGTCQVTVQFRPTAANGTGPQTATLSVPSTGGFGTRSTTANGVTGTAQ